MCIYIYIYIEKERYYAPSTTWQWIDSYLKAYFLDGVNTIFSCYIWLETEKVGKEKPKNVITTSIII